MNDQAIEKEIQEKGLTAPRVTPQHIEDVIDSEQYHVFHGTTFTSCLLTLKNGFTVHGESACASPENFDAELGRKIARDNAKNKIWMLEGYLLRDNLHNEPKDLFERLQLEQNELTERLKKLAAFIDSEGFEKLDVDNKFLLCKQRDEMALYEETLVTRIDLISK